MVPRYSVYGRELEAGEPDRDAWYVRFQDYRDLLTRVETMERDRCTAESENESFRTAAKRFRAEIGLILGYQVDTEEAGK